MCYLPIFGFDFAPTPRQARTTNFSSEGPLKKKFCNRRTFFISLCVFFVLLQFCFSFAAVSLQFRFSFVSFRFPFRFKIRVSLRSETKRNSPKVSRNSETKFRLVSLSFASKRNFANTLHWTIGLR